MGTFPVSRMDTQKVRETLDTTLEAIPKGPAGHAGKGQLFGAANYFAVSTINGLNPVDGLDVGFEVRSQSVEDVDDGELHRFEILASNRRVAEFTAKIRSAPTNIDYLRNRPEIQASEVAKMRDTLNLYSIVVLYPEERDSRGFRDADLDMLV